ncbi:MAG: DUF687 family protein [Parachlamydiales bacterium]
MALEFLSRVTSQLSFENLQHLKQSTPSWAQSFMLSAVVPNPTLERFEFPTGRHPLAAIAEMIEKMRSGSLSLADAQRTVIQLDPASRSLFHDHETTLIDNPSHYFNLFAMAESMANSQRPVDKTAVLEAFNALGTPLRNALAGKIYHFSEDPTKGCCDRWGELHAADDLSCLLKAMQSLTGDIFEGSYEKIKNYALGKLISMPREKQVQAHYEIYRIERPVTQDSNWGENHATDDIPRLITALYLMGSIEGPKAAGCYDRSWETYTQHGSCIFDTPGRKLEKGEIGFINGMGATHHGAVEAGNYIRDTLLQGYAMRNVYGACYGEWNVASAMYGQKGIALPQARMLVKNWSEFFARSNPDEKFLQLCTSRGAIDVYAALQQLPELLQKRIYVITIAPGHIIENTSCLRAFNIIIRDDAVPHLAINSHLMDSGRPEVIIVGRHADGKHPHDAMGSSYLDAVRPLVDQFIRTNTISS